MSDGTMVAGQAIDVGHLIDNSPLSRFQKRVIILGSLATFIDGYDIQALGLAIPGMAKSFAVAPTAFASALSMSLVGVGLGAIIFGPLADRIGRRPVLIGTMFLISLSTFATIWSPSPMIVALTRLLTGLGVGGAVPVALAMTAEYAPSRNRAALVTAMVASMAIGSFAAGILAPVIEARWGWRGIFGTGAIAPLVMAVILYMSYPESMRLLLIGRKRQDEVLRQVALISPSHASSRPFASQPAIQGRARFRDLFSPIYRRRTTLIWIVIWFNLYAAYSLIGWLPTLLQSAGWETAVAQRVTGVLAIGPIVGGIFIAWLSDRGFGIIPLLVAYLGAAVLFCGFLLGADSMVVWIVMLTTAGLGLFGAQAAFVSIAAAFYYPPELCSTGVGWYNAVGRTGAVVGPLLIARQIDAGWAAETILSTLAVPMIVCAIGVLLMPGALRTSAKPLEVK